EVPVGDRTCKDDDIGGEDLLFKKCPVTVCVDAGIVVPALDAPKASSPDVGILEPDELNTARKCPADPFDHPAEITLRVIRICKDQDLLLSRGHRCRYRPGCIGELRPHERGVDPLDRSPLFRCTEEEPRKTLQAPAFRLPQEIAHFCREQAAESHTEIVADRVHVMVCCLVEEVDGCRKDCRIFSPERGPCITFMDQFDEPLVLGGDEQVIERECPDYGIGTGNGSDNLLEHFGFTLDLFDPGCNIFYVVFVLREFFHDVPGVLHSDAAVSFRAAI